MASFGLLVLNIFSLVVYTANSAQITGWIYADNWFELYFNGEKVATDPLVFYPHNAVYIDFTAPDSGLYSFAFKAKDFANDTTGLEPREGSDGSFQGWCIGDGGIRIALSDGTVSSSDWKCAVLMEGPADEQCIANIGADGECLDKSQKPTICTVTYNSIPSCWNETICAEADSWSAATEWTANDVGYGRPPNAQGYGYSYPDICGSNPIYATEGCIPGDKDWGSSSFIWGSDLNFDNRIVCRYSYCVGGGTDCTSEGSPSTTASGTDSPTASPVESETGTDAPTVTDSQTGTDAPSSSPAQTGVSGAPTEAPTGTDTAGSGVDRIYVWVAMAVVFGHMLV